MSKSDCLFAFFLMLPLDPRRPAFENNSLCIRHTLILHIVHSDVFVVIVVVAPLFLFFALFANAMRKFAYFNEYDFVVVRI